MSSVSLSPSGLSQSAPIHRSKKLSGRAKSGLAMLALLPLMFFFTNASIIGTYSWNGYTAYYLSNAWIWGWFDTDRRHQLTEVDPQNRHRNLCVPTALNNLLQMKIRQGKRYSHVQPYLQDKVNSTQFLANWIGTTAQSGSNLGRTRAVTEWLATTSGETALFAGLRHGIEFTPYHVSHWLNAGIGGIAMVGYYDMQARPTMWGGYMIALQRRPVGHAMSINAQYSNWSGIWAKQSASLSDIVVALNAFSSASLGETWARMVSVDETVLGLASRRQDLMYWGHSAGQSNALLYSQASSGSRFHFLPQEQSVTPRNNQRLVIMESYIAMY